MLKPKPPLAYSQAELDAELTRRFLATPNPYSLTKAPLYHTLTEEEISNARRLPSGLKAFTDEEVANAWIWHDNIAKPTIFLSEYVENTLHWAYKNWWRNGRLRERIPEPDNGGRWILYQEAVAETLKAAGEEEAENAGLGPWQQWAKSQQAKQSS